MSKRLAKEKAVEKPDSHALSVRDRSYVPSVDKQNGQSFYPRWSSFMLFGKQMVQISI